MKIKFLGAAKTVTGSCYLIESQKASFLVDCGLFQGEDVYDRNFENFEFDPKKLDFVILTHAHMDHSGLLPKLVKQGFKGSIYLTIPTAQLSEILLLDAAKIQEGSYRKADKPKGASFNTEPLYKTADALRTIEMFESLNFEEEVVPAEGVTFSLVRAGHILGAACVLLDIDGTKIVFSGDLGREKEAIIFSFDKLQGNFLADYVVMESLYGGELHQSREDAAGDLVRMINETIQRSGNVVIPSFAVHKTQEVLAVLKKAFENEAIPNNVQVVLDSPLAIKATGIYENSTGYFDTVNTEETKGSLRNTFKFPNLRISHSQKQSMKYGGKRNSIFIAGSGMAEGGRVIRHLIHNLPGKNNTVIFVGYQAENTKGREILEGAKEVILDRKMVKISAKIERIEGFSSHADHKDLLSWLSNFKTDSLDKVFLTHADPERSIALESDLKQKGYNTNIPEWKEEALLNHM